MAQPHKGPRKLLATRLPSSEAHEVEQRAKRLGLTVSDYVALALRDALANPAPRIHRQEELDVSA